MDLTREERGILSGERGPAARMAMEIIVQIAEAYGASELIPITQAHVDGCTYASTGDAGIEFAQRLAGQGGRVVVPTTTNITARDVARWREFRIPEEHSRKSAQMEKAYLDMGCIPSWTCAPYQYAVTPRFGEQIAWAESNAINFVNSVIGARTARYGDYIDICSGLTGRAPRFGYHLGEERIATIQIQFDEFEEVLRLNGSAYAAAGYACGLIASGRVPVVTGLPGNTGGDHLKAFSAAAASSGATGMFHVVGITPEAPSLEAATGGKDVPAVRVSARELLARLRHMSSSGDGRVDLVTVGCPHYSVAECLEVEHLLAGRSIAAGTEFWVNTNRAVLSWLDEMGVSNRLRSLGIRLTTDSCVMHWPLDNWGFETIMTDSGKFAHYGPMETGKAVIFSGLRDCVEAAVTGGFSFPDALRSAGSPSVSAGDVCVAPAAPSPAPGPAPQAGVKVVVRGRARGEALVSPAPISFWGSVDISNGRIIERNHPLLGQDVTGKVLVYPEGKGSSSTSGILLELARNGHAPLAIVNRVAEPIISIGCVVAQKMYGRTIPILALPEEQYFRIRTGDVVDVDGEAGAVCVVRPA
ncbi:MAG: DUF521 domain-containing protein [Firmicutes bacterium]|nr:DUF521 domain-containing protein [Bacillota bacterium]